MATKKPVIRFTHRIIAGFGTKVGVLEKIFKIFFLQFLTSQCEPGVKEKTGQGIGTFAEQPGAAGTGQGKCL